jgi:hypothetical protein
MQVQIAACIKTRNGGLHPPDLALQLGHRGSASAGLRCGSFQRSLRHHRHEVCQLRKRFGGHP